MSLSKGFSMFFGLFFLRWRKLEGNDKFLVALAILSLFILGIYFFIKWPFHSNSFLSLEKGLNDGNHFWVNILKVSPTYYWSYARYSDYNPGRIFDFYFDKEKRQYCLDTWIDENKVKKLDCNADLKYFFRYYPESDFEIDEVLTWTEYYRKTGVLK